MDDISCVIDLLCSTLPYMHGKVTLVGVLENVLLTRKYEKDFEKQTGESCWLEKLVSRRPSHKTVSFRLDIDLDTNRIV